MSLTNNFKKKIQLGKASFEFSTGVLARQASSILVQCEESIVLSTFCSGKILEDLDFVPLSVEYNEKHYSVGKIPGGFFKQEGRPKAREILISRLIDRPIRPLLYKTFKRELQLIPTVISSDQIYPTDITAMLASFLSVYISNVPFMGPVAAVRVIYKDGNFILNPTHAEIDNAELELIVTGDKQGISMVEGAASEVGEDIFIAAIEQSIPLIKQFCIFQEEFLSELGTVVKLDLMEEKTINSVEEIKTEAQSKIHEICFLPSKQARSDALAQLKERLCEQFVQEDKDKKIILSIVDGVHKEILRDTILREGKRLDGRVVDKIRSLDCRTAILPRAHGSSLFTRGETQSLGVVTLGTVFDEQILDDIEGNRRDKFLLQYNFPPFSTGETGRLGGSRREVGHSSLAKRSIAAILPSEDVFPYTIRIVSDILESNGSSSMATVCSASLALLSAGVPIKSAVAGIAMGLIYRDEDNYAVLTDILGEEDHLGDMDFKVAGTYQGITGFQMDIKISGISLDLLKKALYQAKEARLFILDHMKKCISQPSASLSVYAPIIQRFMVDQSKLGLLIGGGGKNLRQVTEAYSVEVNVGDKGLVYVSGRVQSSVELAVKRLQSFIEEPEIGKVYNGVVKKVLDFGAFIEILPGKEGLCHISKLGQKVSDIHSFISEGQEVTVRLLNIDASDRLSLTLISKDKLTK